MKIISSTRMRPACLTLCFILGVCELDAVKVGVIGGGITGVYTARKLSQKGYQVTVINDGELGGRIKALSYKGKKYDHGAMEVGSHYDWTIPLIKKYDLHLVEAPPVYDLKTGSSLSQRMLSTYGVWPTVKSLPGYAYATKKFPYQSYGYDQSIDNSTFSQGTLDFLKGMGLKSMADPLGVVLPFYGYSHGFREASYTPEVLNEVPAAHAVKVFPSKLAWDITKSSIPVLQNVLPKAAFTIEEGFEGLFSHLYNEAENLGVEFTQDKIDSVQYDDLNKTVILKGEKDYEFDQVISTVMPGEMTGLQVKGLTEGQKEAILKMKYNYYGTTIFELTDVSSKKIPERQYANFEYSGYEPSILLNKFPNDRVWLGYNYVQGLTLDDYEKSQQALKTTLLKTFGVKEKSVNILSQRYVKYYPHPEDPKLMGALTKEFNSMQGMYNGRLYFTGAMWDFDIVDGVIRHADQMTDRYFSGVISEFKDQ